MNVKPGYLTTEFWTHIIGGVIGILAMAGVLTPAQASQLVQAVTSLAGALVVIASIISYVASRTQVKKADALARAQTQIARATPPPAAAPDDPAAGLVDTPPAPRYGATPASPSNPPIRVPSTLGFTDPANATRASSL